MTTNWHLWTIAAAMLTLGCEKPVKDDLKTVESELRNRFAIDLTVFSADRKGAIMNVGEGTLMFWYKVVLPENQVTRAKGYLERCAEGHVYRDAHVWKKAEGNPIWWDAPEIAKSEVYGVVAQINNLWAEPMVTISEGAAGSAVVHFWGFWDAATK